ncbi:MAG TPA: ABC transporter permease, partial [Aquabacterium sp.]|nr:ABC transporter permease [Aquabacterium sp.]
MNQVTTQVRGAAAPKGPGLWTVRGGIPRQVYWVLALIGLLLPLLGWWLASVVNGADAVFLPSPGKVWERTCDWWVDGGLNADIAISVYRVVGGFALSAVIALPLGLMIG